MGRSARYPPLYGTPNPSLVPCLPPPPPHVAPSSPTRNFKGTPQEGYPLFSEAHIHRKAPACSEVCSVATAQANCDNSTTFASQGGSSRIWISLWDVPLILTDLNRDLVHGGTSQISLFVGLSIGSSLPRLPWASPHSQGFCRALRGFYCKRSNPHTHSASKAPKAQTFKPLCTHPSSGFFRPLLPQSRPPPPPSRSLLHPEPLKP